MDIIVQGVIVNALPIQQGVSQKTGNQWSRASYIIEHEGGQYPKRMVFDVKNAKIQEFALQIGQQVTVHLNVDAREYNGRYFNDIEAWKVERPGQVQQPMQGYAPQQGYQPMAQMPPVQQQAMPQQGYQAPVAGQQQFPPQQPQPAQPQQQGLPFPPAQ
jgi:hypothetical protein